ncbi:hypothetical protein [Micromonospora echinaurantiaca]|uniref:hypothetical protein n=1 Tax=Micromonospora echinaurantiaca TaxID=47857 RepID=UPI0037BA7A0D
MLPTDPPTAEPAGVPAEPARRAKDDLAPAGPPVAPADAPPAEGAGGADVAGEYEPL